MIYCFRTILFLIFLIFTHMMQAALDPDVARIIEKIQGVTIDPSKSCKKNKKQLKELSQFLKEYDQMVLEKGQDYRLYKYLVSPPYDFEVRDSSLRGFANAIVQLDEASIAIGFVDNTIGIFNLETAEREVTLFGHKDRISALCALKNGHFVSGADDGEVIIWSPKIYKQHLTIGAHTGSVLSIIELEDQRFATASTDKTIKIWNTDGGCERVLVGHGLGVSALVQLDEKRIASASWDHTVKIWDVAEGIVLQTLEGHDDIVTTLVRVNDTTLASGSDDESLIIWDITTGSCVRRIQENYGWIMASCQLDSGFLATSSTNGVMIIWNPLNGTKMARFVDPCQKRVFSVSSIIQLQNGNLIALSDEKILRLLECYTNDIREIFISEKIIDNCLIIALIIALEKAFKAKNRIILEADWMKLFDTIPSRYRKNYAQILDEVVLYDKNCAVM